MKTIITQEEIKKIRAIAEELDETEDINPKFLDFIYRALMRGLFPDSFDTISLFDDKCIESLDDETLLIYDELKGLIFEIGFKMGYTYGVVCGEI